MRPMPSASAISVKVAPETSAFALLARRPSRRSSVVDAGLAFRNFDGESLALAHACQSARRCRVVRHFPQSALFVLYLHIA